MSIKNDVGVKGASPELGQFVWLGTPLGSGLAPVELEDGLLERQLAANGHETKAST